VRALSGADINTVGRRRRRRQCFAAAAVATVCADDVDVTKKKHERCLSAEF